MDVFLKNLFKNFLIIVLIFLLLGGLFSLFSPIGITLEEIPLSKLASDITNEKIKKIEVVGDKILAEYIDGKRVFSKKEAGISIFETLNNLGVPKEKLAKVNIDIKTSGNNWLIIGFIIFGILPLLLFALFFFFMFKQAKRGTMQTFDFTKTRARIFGAEGHPKEKITFKDVGGLKEAKEELLEVVDFLKNPKKYLQIGARIPKGILLVGPAGCGKTMLARAVAGESNVPFFHISGSEFVELFVGVGAARVRSLFQEAKKRQPSIIFVDELDAIGKVRGPAIAGGHEEREQTLNQLLVEMDGFEPNDKVIVLAACNRPDILDPALLRPGRFDRKIVLDLSDVKEREEILKIHCKNKPLDKDVDLEELAKRTPGFSGADLANLVNEAAILAARRNKTKITQKELSEAFEKVLLGPEKKSKVFSEKEKKISAYHEAGHALVSMLSPHTEPVKKVSIVARGLAAGYTLKLPKEDRHFRTKKEFLDELAVLLGGWCAERIVFKDVSTGASNDLEIASSLARKIVKEYGMSDKLGPVVFGKKEGLVFLGKEFGEERNYSEKTAQEIDREVKNLILNAKKRAKNILKRKRKLLDRIAKALIEKETLEKEELEKLVKRGKKS
ncbi:MAG: ATP-dependent zinc metalloprotease FtsH [Candidatus Pacebacteria bacterium]|nr:ATP-dependent zinc metalloprotease FtsH [Candidatus Paceibacterota bacterium]